MEVRRELRWMARRREEWYRTWLFHRHKKELRALWDDRIERAHYDPDKQIRLRIYAVVHIAARQRWWTEALQNAGKTACQSAKGTPPIGVQKGL